MPRTDDPDDIDMQAVVAGSAIDQFGNQMTALFLADGVKAKIVEIERFLFTYPDVSPIIRDKVRTTLGHPFAEELATKVASLVYDVATVALEDRLERADVRIDEDS